jgi:hypothetical protein
MERIGQPHAVIIDSSQEKREGKYRMKYEESSPTLEGNRDIQRSELVIKKMVLGTDLKY